MTQWGYARVSTTDQDVAAQRRALEAAGVEPGHIIEEQASGAKRDRPGLVSLLEQLERGDVLVVWKLDRLGRSLRHLLEVIDNLKERGVEFRSLTDGLDTTTPAGQLMFAICGAFAEFERSMALERTMTGLDAAKERGVHLGRPSEIPAERAANVFRLHAEGRTHRHISQATSVSKSAVGRLLRGEIPSVESALAAYLADQPSEISPAGVDVVWPTRVQQELFARALLPPADIPPE